MSETSQPSIEPKPENPLASFSTEQLAVELVKRLGKLPESTESHQTLRSALDAFISPTPKESPREKSTEPETPTDETPTDQEEKQVATEPTTPHSENQKEEPKETRSDSEIAHEFARLIREHGIAFLDGKFPRNLRTSTGELLSNDKDFEAFTLAGEIGIHTGGDVGLMNCFKPRYNSALYDKREALNPRSHYFSGEAVNFARLQQNVVDYKISLGDHMKEIIEEGLKNQDRFIIATLTSFIADDFDRYGGRGTRGHDLPLIFRFAIPEKIMRDHNLSLTPNVIRLIYDSLYPGIENQLVRRPADSITFIEDPFRFSSEMSDQWNWIRYLKDPEQCKVFRYLQTVGVAPSVDKLK